MSIDRSQAETFLATQFDGACSDVTPLGQGVWSTAFAFRQAGGDYVIRFGAHREDFAKDRLAARYASSGLPIPRFVELGKAFGGVVGGVVGVRSCNATSICRSDLLLSDGASRNLELRHDLALHDLALN